MTVGCRDFLSLSPSDLQTYRAQIDETLVYWDVGRIHGTDLAPLIVSDVEVGI